MYPCVQSKLWVKITPRERQTPIFSAPVRARKLKEEPMKIVLAVVGVVVPLLVLGALIVGGSYVSSKNEMVRKK